MKGPINKEIFNAIKKVIKSKGKTYKDVADYISMSESGFKKLMSCEDCSLNKLQKVCESLNMNLSEILDLAGNMDGGQIVISKKQEDIFIKNPSAYYFFIELLKFDYDEEKIRKTHKLTKKTTLKYLRKLDKLNLIKLEIGNKIVPVISSNTSIGISPRLAKIVRTNLDKTYLDYIHSQFQSDKKGYKTRYGGRGSFYLREKAIKEMEQGLQNLNDEFGRRSAREQVLYGKQELKKVSTMIFMTEGYNESDHIKIDNI